MRLLARDGTIDALLLLRSNTIIVHRLHGGRGARVESMLFAGRGFLSSFT
jgi:hypothetical protein